MVTPTHIVPEWYFLPFYAILRSIPDKLGGVIAMFAAIIILFFLPWLNTSMIRNIEFKSISKKLFWLLLANCIILGWIGGNSVEYPFVEIGQLSASFYFMYFVCLLPLSGIVENYFIISNIKK